VVTKSPFLFLALSLSSLSSLESPEEDPLELLDEDSCWTFLLALVIFSFFFYYYSFFSFLLKIVSSPLDD